MSQRILFIDTETGGLDAERQSLLTLGLAVWKDGVVEDSIEIKVAEDIDPAKIIADPEALAVNGIDLKALAAEGVTPRQAVNQVHAFLLKHDIYGRKVTLGGHNVPFDVAFLKRLYRLAGLEEEFRKQFSHRLICTQVIANFLIFMKLVPYTIPNGDTVFKFYGCEPQRVDGRHEARGDAVASGKAFTAMMRDVRRESLK